MTIPLKSSLLVAIALTLTLAACGDDDGPTGGGPADTTPPSVTAVTPVDLYHVDVTFSEAVTKASAENTGNYTIAESAALVGSRVQAAAPGDPVLVAGITLHGNGKTVTLTTGSTMAGVPCDLTIDGVADVHGNVIGAPIEETFTGSIASDETAPEVVRRSPAPDAVNVPVGTSVVIQFSEIVTSSSVDAGVAWTSQAGPVLFYFDRTGTTVTLHPWSRLSKNTLQTISLSGIQDVSGNTTPDMEWSFRTTNVTDETPPTLVSSSPANFAANVSVHTNISLTFSEPVDQNVDVELSPFVSYPDITFSNGGKTVILGTNSLLADNQQYVISLYPGAVVDLAGNGFEGYTTVTFSTGSLAGGSIAGTITGHPGTAASDPTGAVVFAFGYEMEASGAVAANDTYRLSHVADDTYEVFAFLDTDHDGNAEFFSGDAIGAYGIDIANGDLFEDSLVVSGGNQVSGINFPIFDPSALSGNLTYQGIHENESWSVYLGLYDTSSFDPVDPGLPVASTDSYPGDYEWLLHSVFDEFPDGDYYLAAFLDVDGDGYYPGYDPIGWYGGGNSPTVIHVANGNDFHNIVFAIVDPSTPGSASGQAMAWRTTKVNATLKHLAEAANAVRCGPPGSSVALPAPD